MRVRIENWQNDVSGTGLTFLVSGTAYTDQGESCALDIGIPDSLQTVLLQLQRLQQSGRAI